MIQRPTDLYAPIRNRLLDALPTIEYERLLPNLEEVPLAYNTILYDVGDTLTHVYFPNDGIISLLLTDQVETLEVGIVGREGMAGLPLFMGVKTSRVRSLVQPSGTAMRMKADDLKNECRRGGVLAGLLLRFSYSMMLQVWQSATCYRRHTIEERIIRRLLMTNDRMETNDFEMTQRFLSSVVGVRREAINKVAINLKREGLIDYSHGFIEIIDRPGLEAAACECYPVIRDDEASSQISRQFEPS